MYGQTNTAPTDLRTGRLHRVQAIVACLLLAAGVGLAPLAASPPTQSQTPPVAKASVSSQVTELVRMTESGVDASVVKAYVENSANADRPSADEVIYLRDHGVSPAVVSALIRRAGELHDQASRARQQMHTQAAQQSDSAAAAAAAPWSSPSYVQPAPGYVPSYSAYPPSVYSAPPVYSYYSYPSYPYYPYSWWWNSWYPYPFFTSFGFFPGFGFRHHDFDHDFDRDFDRGFHGGFRGGQWNRWIGAYTRPGGSVGGFHGMVGGARGGFAGGFHGGAVGGFRGGGAGGVRGGGFGHGGGGMHR